MDLKKQQRPVGAAALFLSFTKVGIIGFGGGSALIPVVEREIVHKCKAISIGEYTKHTVIANITPGALPVKLGATCGQQLAGVFGSVASAYGVMLPGTFLTVLFMALFSVAGANTIKYFSYASVGISAFIVFLLVSYIQKTVNHGNKSKNLAMCAIAFLLTGGSETHEIIHAITGIPLNFPVIFDISTINLMILTLFLILTVTFSRRKMVFAIGCTLSFGYVICIGKLGVSMDWNRSAGIPLGAMALFLITLFFTGLKTSGQKSIQSGLSKDLLVTIACYTAIPAMCIAVFLLLGGRGIGKFLMDIGISTITSFGGGEAYVSVADGIFVKGGYIEPGDFYTRLVPVANALPGPILVKIAAGIGYQYGASLGSSVFGWMLALTSAGIAVGSCSAVAVVLMHIYDSAKDSLFILTLKTNILPVICGMLISTSLAMLYESMKIVGGDHLVNLLFFAMATLWISALIAISRKKHINDLIFLSVSALLSLFLLFFYQM